MNFLYAFPTRITAASLYGVGIVTDAPDSPHLPLDKIKGELYYGFAEVDQQVPDKVIPELRAALARAGTRHEIEVHAGTRHGYCFAERQTDAPVASEASWARVFSLWQRNLK